MQQVKFQTKKNDQKTGSLPETKSLPLKNGWLEYDPLLLGFGLFSELLLLVSGRVSFWTESALLLDNNLGHPVLEPTA